MARNSVAFNEFVELNTEQELLNYVNCHDNEELVKLLLEIKKRRAISWEDRAILQMIEKSPLTLWASDKAYKVVLWAGACKEVYHKDLKGKPFYEVMSIYERAQAMEDSIAVIKADDELDQLLEDFRNYYTKDLQGIKKDFSLVTNSMQLVDNETGEKYYAEIGLPINIEQALSEHLERQKRFDAKVKEFDAKVQKLKEEFVATKDGLITLVNQAKGLDSDQKKALRKRINAANTTITANLKKAHTAFDFETFLQDNKEAIEDITETLESEINNAIKELPATITDIPNKENPDMLSAEYDKVMELVRITFESEITRINATQVNARLKKERDKIVIALEDKKAELIRELLVMKEKMASCPPNQLDVYRCNLELIKNNLGAELERILNS